jgi:hypothetical protein
MPRLPKPGHSPRAARDGELVHVDVAGPFTPSLSGNDQFLSDDGRLLKGVRGNTHGRQEAIARTLTTTSDAGSCSFGRTAGDGLYSHVKECPDPRPPRYRDPRVLNKDRG